MDDIDKALYKELCMNARTTISALSAKVALSMPAVSERVRRLENEGYIGGFTVTPGEKFNEAYPVAMQSMVKLKKADQWDSFQEYLDRQNFVTWYGTTTGHFDYVIHIVAKDTNHVQHILRDINSLPSVLDMESSLLLNQKNKYFANLL
ncbi:transcriptional regulator [Anaerovibrio sp. JC8]|uniref:Lrp/AsnC family transcriptional regulator n=1 Tax=Anaerovibrio sp. JC8 TaxID=1240085 RepID=UPI000A0B8E7C|nr:Lrp/AsnC family transcriptional regulator [Anaerovibrio sp. JC8]ORT98777.1 transcriptional regulator [Anaerovibrio sp. JC8]